VRLGVSVILLKFYNITFRIRYETDASGYHNIPSNITGSFLLPDSEYLCTL